MSTPLGTFDPTLVPVGWFGESGQAAGWFDADLLDSGAAPAADVRPPDCEWDWSEAAPGDAIPTGYQNASLGAVVSARQVEDAWDWSEQADDDWQDLIDDADDARRAATSTGRVLQDDWDWSEPLPSDVIPTGYQQADVLADKPVQQLEWDWSEFVSGDLLSIGYQNADVAAVAPTGRVADLEWDFAADFGGEDGWNNHYTAYDVPPVFGFEWDWDEAVFGEWVPTGYQNANATVVADPIQPRDAEWDWDEVLAPEIVAGGYQNADFTPVASPAQPTDTVWDFDGEAIAEDGWNNHYTAYDVPRIPDMDWDWDECVYGEWVLVGYQQADAQQLAAPTRPVQDVWDWAEGIDDEWQSDVILPANVVVVASPVQQRDAEWDWSEAGDDDQVLDDSRLVNAAVALVGILPADAWDWDESLDDDLVALIGGALALDGAIAPIDLQGALYVSRQQTATSRPDATDGARPRQAGVSRPAAAGGSRSANISKARR